MLLEFKDKKKCKKQLRKFKMFLAKISLLTVKSETVFQGFILVLFTNPSAQAGYDTKSIFKWSLTGLNSEFSFS